MFFGKFDLSLILAQASQQAMDMEAAGVLAASSNPAMGKVELRSSGMRAAYDICCRLLGLDILVSPTSGVME